MAKWLPRWFGSEAHSSRESARASGAFVWIPVRRWQWVVQHRAGHAGSAQTVAGGGLLGRIWVSSGLCWANGGIL